MSNDRTSLSALATQLGRRGVILVRSASAPNYLELRILKNQVIATVAMDDLFDGDGNRFEDDLP